MRKLKPFTLALLLFCLISPGLAWGKTHHATSPIVTLCLDFANESHWQQMRFSNDNGQWSNPESITTTRKGWDITANIEEDEDACGIYCVYAKFQDNDGNWSESIVACLIWDRSKPLPTPEEPAPPVTGRGCLGIF